MIERACTCPYGVPLSHISDNDCGFLSVGQELVILAAAVGTGCLFQPPLIGAWYLPPIPRLTDDSSSVQLFKLQCL